MFKSVELEKFIEHNKELVESDNFKLTLKIRNIGDIPEHDMKEYQDHKELWEETLFNKVKEALNDKLEIIYY